MEQLIVDLLKDWGPAAMGWVAAWVIWKEYRRIAAKSLEIINGNTEALTRLSTLIRDRKDG